MKKLNGVGINPELPVVLIISFLLIAGGIIVVFFVDISQFNFYSSKISVNGMEIQEELHYKPDKPYHTLYRNFESPVYINYDNGLLPNYLIVNDVQCSSGQEYIKDYYGNCYRNGVKGELISCFLYTENNEYGCAFGEILGFSKGEDYVINAEYEIHPENLFMIKGNYYFKFVVYSPNNHIKLTEENFIINGEVVKKDRYSISENVILYIPYNGETSGFNIIETKDFEFDSSRYFFKIIFGIIPGLFFFFFWFFIGKERTYGSIPKELTGIPTERKFWEVAAYFNPPLFRVDKNLFASVLLNFYNNKIIDIKEKDKDIYIKLNGFKGDETEKKIYDILELVRLNLRDERDKKFVLGEYFNLKGFMNSFYYTNVVRPLVFDKYKELKENVEENGNFYIEKTPVFVKITILFLFSGCLLFLIPLLSEASRNLIFFYVFSFVLISIFSFNNALLSRFKGEYYVEYQKWRAFKRYLKNSFSIKTATHKTIVIWDEYLLYATALGVPEKVIKELKANNIITKDQTRIYTGISTGSFFGSAFSSSGGGAGGGVGGAGGGGVGGGGGGGR